MSQSVEYGYMENGCRIVLRLDADGAIVVQAQTPRGDVQTYEDEIDPEDCQGIIEALFHSVPQLPDRPTGDLTVALFNDDQRWDYRLLEQEVPTQPLDVGRIARHIVADTRAYFEEHAARVHGPKETRMTAVGFATWSVAFAVAYVGSVAVGVAIMLGSTMIGPMAMGLAYGLAGFLLVGSYWTVGSKFGEQYRRAFPVWPTAVVGCAPFIIALAIIDPLGNGLKLLAMGSLPVWAEFGRSTST